MLLISISHLLLFERAMTTLTGALQNSIATGRRLSNFPITPAESAKKLGSELKFALLANENSDVSLGESIYVQYDTNQSISPAM